MSKMLRLSVMLLYFLYHQNGAQPFTNDKATNTDIGKSTREILRDLGQRSIEGFTVMELIDKSTGITAEDFAKLYHLTQEQQQTLHKATFLQMSETCGIPVSQLLDMSLPNISLRIVGSMYASSPCSIMVKEKGVPINTFGITNPGGKTALQLLLAATGQKWRKARLTECLPLDKWDLLDSTTVVELSQITETNLTELLTGSVHDLITLIKAKGLESQMKTHALKVVSILEKFFNVTLSVVSTLTGGSRQDIQSPDAPRLVEAFINATASYFGVTLSSIYTPIGISLDELFKIPIAELQDIAPYIIKASIELQAEKLDLSKSSMYSFMNVFPSNGTISTLKIGLRQVKNRFQKQTFARALMQMTVLEVLQVASSSNADELGHAFALTQNDMDVLEKLKVIDIPKNCGAEEKIFPLKNRTNACVFEHKGISVMCELPRYHERNPMNTHQQPSPCDMIISSMTNADIQLMMVIWTAFSCIILLGVIYLIVLNNQLQWKVQGLLQRKYL